MKILYGVVGEGMGHATRSKVVLAHLAEAGHEIKIVVSGRAHDYLRRHFPDVAEIHGLRMIYEDNAVSRHRTAWDFLKSLPRNVADNVETYQAIAGAFDPQVVIADFESFAYLFGKQRGKPVLSIDNMQIINRCAHDETLIPAESRASFRLAKTIVKAKLPGCRHYFITTFFFPPVRKARTSLHPPILREAILGAKAASRRGDHVLVYQTSASDRDLVPTLQRMKGEFRVYGLLRGEEPEQELGNVRLRRFSESGFVEDLATSRCVVAGGGFSLMGEAVYLGKPMLSVPLGKQFEQTLNALYLARLGYGEYQPALSEGAIHSFLEREAGYAERLATYRQEGNRELLAAVDRLLAEIADGRTGAEEDDEDEEEAKASDIDAAGGDPIDRPPRS